MRAGLTEVRSRVKGGGANQDIEARNEEDEDDIQEKEKKGLYKNLGLFVVMLLLIIVAAVSTASMGKHRKPNDLEIWLDQSDEDVFNTTQKEASRYRKTGVLPTFGITKGKYYVIMASKRKEKCHLCGQKLLNFCGYDATNATNPPLELLRPGRLGLRKKLKERSQCFLWYGNSFWTRPTGGGKGMLLTRLGAGIDDKARLNENLKEYDKNFSCPDYQVNPVTLDLNDTKSCLDFYQKQEKFTSNPDGLWFMKDTKGSTGRHISLTRRKDVEEKVAKEGVHCPENSSLASLEVPDIWTIDNHKFDNRVYLLVDRDSAPVHLVIVWHDPIFDQVANVKPLTLFFRKGHLRFSMQNYTDSSFQHGTVSNKIVGHKPEQDENLARHITNPRFGMSFTNDTNDVIKPVELMRDTLIKEKGQEKGEKAWQKLQTSVRNAALQAFYSMRQRYLNFAYATRWGFAFIAFDVAYDKHQNAFILDMNSGPSFYHHYDYPKWLVEERSAIIREMFDIVQEAAFRKILQSKNHSHLPFETKGDWDYLFNDAAGGSTRPELINYGQCARLSYH